VICKSEFPLFLGFAGFGCQKSTVIPADSFEPIVLGYRPFFCQGSMRLCAHLQILRITMSHNSLPVNRLNIDLATPCNETFQTEAPDS